MFEITFKPAALASLRQLERFHAVEIVDAIERHLRHEPEKPSKSLIKKLRGKQQSTLRLRVGAYRVFYDVVESEVLVVAILHKADTIQFYRPEETP
jgi:mRNA interferase RelE/StbE